jgi:hypothetical protein
MLAVLPTVAAAQEPTPDPSLDVRPDPAPVRSQAGSAKQPAAHVQKEAPEHGSSAPTPVSVAGPSTTAAAAPSQSAMAHSRPAPASRGRTGSAARERRPHERTRRTHRSAPIATLRQLAPRLAAPPWLRSAARPTPSGGDSDATLLLFAGLALLLLVAASGSLIRLTTRLSGDARGEPGP